MDTYKKTFGTLHIEGTRAVYVGSPHMNVKDSLSEATSLAWEQRAPILSGVIKPEQAMRYELLTNDAAIKSIATYGRLPPEKGIKLTPDILDTTQTEFKRRIEREMQEMLWQNAPAYAHHPSPAPAVAAPQPVSNKPPPVMPAASPPDPQKFAMTPWSKGK